jgi:hypothetical protein
MPRSEKGALKTGRFRVLRVATIEEGGLKLKVNQQQLVIKPTIEEGGMR